MDVISDLGTGFAAIMDPALLLMLVLGVLVGSIVGVLPGVGPVGAMALLLPLSFALDPGAGLILIAGIYLGAQYGGSTSSILLGVPGEASSVVTTLDGHPMARNGRAGVALAISAIGSFVAGTLGVLLLMVIAKPLSSFAAQFAPPEYLALALFALLVLSRLAGGSIFSTFAAVGLGLMLATIGLDSTTGAARFTLGNADLLQGVEVTAVAVGVFGIAEVLLLAEESSSAATRVARVPFRSMIPTRTDLRRATPAIFRGSLLGFGFGLIPGPSAVVSTYASYFLEKRLSKHKDEFGKGAIEGVAGPESANNGAAGGSMVPLLILGLPFNAPTALLIAGFTIHGVIPGPLFIDNEPVLFWTLIAGLFAANVVLLVFNLPLVGLFTSLLRVPKDLLLALIVVVAILGTYGTRGRPVDVFWLLVMGILGYLMVKIGISRIAFILAFVMGPLLESSLKQTIVLARGDAGYLLGRPISMVVIVITVIVLTLPIVVRRIAARRNATSPLDMEIDAT